MHTPAARTLNMKPYEGLDDFTRYIARPETAAKLSPSDGRDLAVIEGLLDTGEEDRSRRAVSLNETIHLGGFGEFRTLICSCFGGEYYSLTCRKGRSSGTKEKAEPSIVPAEAIKNGNPLSGYGIQRKDAKPPFLFGMHTYAETLFEVIFGPKKRFETKNGLVVVGGSTAGGKSTILRGLIDGYLAELVKTRAKPGNRRPHLITFEDPIEVRYSDDPGKAALHGIDYTPRQRHVDVADLPGMLLDCLRQTPDAVYIGETRNLADWKELVDFAGTGHLVFTTCHAGSLTEMIGTLLKAVDAETAAGRSVLASRLLAAIHLRPAKIGDREPQQAILPGVWVRTPAGVNALTSDGLAAILPRVFSSGQDSAGDKARYCFGRTYFAEQMPSSAGRPPIDALVSRAIQFDLEGL